ncbi:MAG: molybdenum cofactor guanylyltransferase [Bacteroidales bacterium]|nr:molybdenum cofactor guanylyltransferase [Bacteroidales bacterium]
MNKDLTAIILAGGKSSRFGSDKALAMFQGKTLIQHAVDIVSPVTSNIIISANTHAYDFLNHKVVADIYKDAGPMGGLHAALSQSNTSTNLVITTDTPFLKSELYTHLLNQRNSEQITLAASADHFVHPLCGIYSASSLIQIQQFLDKKTFKMMQLVKSCTLSIININPELDFFTPELFDNFNRPQDLNKDYKLYD